MTSDDRPSWDATWLKVAESIAPRSRCVRASIGAVIVTESNRIVSTGYNGPAASWPHAGPCSRWCPRAQGKTPLDNTYDECPSIHAEENAIAYVDRSAVDGGTIYVTSTCCMKCAKLISNSGIRRIVMSAPTEDDTHRKPEKVLEYLEKCGLQVIVYAADMTIHTIRGPLEAW